MPAYVPTAEEVCMASKVCTQYFCLSPCLSHQTILTQCDMVLLEVVKGQLLLKDQMCEYMDHGDFWKVGCTLISFWECMMVRH